MNAKERMDNRIKRNFSQGEANKNVNDIPSIIHGDKKDKGKVNEKTMKINYFVTRNKACSLLQMG